MRAFGNERMVMGHVVVVVCMYKQASSNWMQIEKKGLEKKERNGKG